MNYDKAIDWYDHITAKQTEYILNLQEQTKTDKYSYEDIIAMTKKEASDAIHYLLKVKEWQINKGVFDWDQFKNNGGE